MTDSGADVGLRDDLLGGPDTGLDPKPFGERLQLFAVAGGQHDVGPFLRKGFGRGRANALGGAGDQDALAAEMQIHGISRLGEGR